MLRAGGGVSVIMVLVFLWRVAAVAWWDRLRQIWRYTTSTPSTRRRSTCTPSPRRRSTCTPSPRRATTVLAGRIVIQQAQEATVTGMGLGDDGFVVGSSQAERLSQQRHDVALLAGLDDFGGRL
jgi:hypothetical protein